MQRFVASKWKKTKALMAHPEVKSYIPRTEIFNRATLADMLAKYRMVYMKPDLGTHGIGVIRVERTSKLYKYQAGSALRTFSGYEELYRSLKAVTKNRKYLVQKGIDLLKYQGRRFDIRVMVQQNPAGRWESTAMVGRVAGAGKIVTNVHNGGMLKPVPVLMSAYLGEAERRNFAAKLLDLGLKAAKRLDARYPGLKEIGLDIGVDRNSHPWIFEVNTCPDPYIFRVLKDKQISRKVLRYARAYGRIPSRRK